MGNNNLSSELSKKTNVLGLKLWGIIGVAVAVIIVITLLFLCSWLLLKRRRSSSKRKHSKLSHQQQQEEEALEKKSLEIKEVKIDRVGNTYLPPPDPILVTISENSGEKESMEKGVVHVGDPQSGSFKNSIGSWRAEKEQQRGTAAAVAAFVDMGGEVRHHHHYTHENPNNNMVILPSPPQFEASAEKRGSFGHDTIPPLDNKTHSFLSLSGGSVSARSIDSPVSAAASAASAAPEVSHLGWGHWYTLRELEAATNNFGESNVVGEGGYGIVYRGQLPDGTMVAVKNLLNNRGQAEKEFRVEVEAIGRVRHKNLVRLLGYCAEGAHRMLVYEYVDNGNLEQWLHGPVSKTNPLPWETRMKIVLGTAKGLAYLHEALEPKVVHRDIKSSNILVDSEWNAKVSDFGLAKLLGSGKSHVTTRVMGTFGYVAPEYANTGLLNERSDVYSFGVLLMEIITGRDPVDYNRAAGEINLVDWLKQMVGNRRSEEVADPSMELKPTSRALKRSLLVALRCVDPDALKRPKIGHVVHMLEAEEFPFRDDRKVGSTNVRSHRTEAQSQERLLQRLSAGQSADDSDTSVEESPATKAFVKRNRNWETTRSTPRRYEG
ncbi:hypothetical protein CY35_07G068300 [Sphagnum magellanicum]|uniref:Uncharacterized protein n=1 Tax=Sphagnum magellanicum TaxID=128215 RepID=A0ACB8HLL2_9BRYO|nr:hypothetical protein CY35_07G068300 [Sphagnum magellanicum]